MGGYSANSQTEHREVCDDVTCGFAIWKENRFFTAKKKTVTKAIVTELLKSGKVPLTGCYSEKTGKTYDCIAVLDDTGGQYVNFGVSLQRRRNRARKNRHLNFERCLLCLIAHVAITVLLTLYLKNIGVSIY